MQPSRRLERIPPYLFAQLEQKIAAITSVSGSSVTPNRRL